MIDDLGRYAIYLNSHLRLIIDESIIIYEFSD